jgi:methyl-accepting chemotaxis protein
MNIEQISNLDMQRKNGLVGTALVVSSLIGLAMQLGISVSLPSRLVMIGALLTSLAILFFNRRNQGVYVLPYVAVLGNAVVVFYLMQSPYLVHVLLVLIMIAASSIYMRRMIFLFASSLGLFLFTWFMLSNWEALRMSTLNFIFYSVYILVICILLFFKTRISSYMILDLQKSNAQTEALLREEQVREVQLRKSTESISDMINNIFHRNSSSFQAMTDMNQAFHEMASGAGAQSEAIATISLKAEESSQFVNRMVTEAEVLEQKAIEARDSSLKGTKQIEALSETIHQFRDSIEIMNQEMHELTECVRNVSLSTKSIQDIASKTNILSLNAGIEAARSGQESLGFAVIAKEIRMLAANTSVLSEDIMERIEDIEHRTQTTQQLTQVNFEQMKKSIELTEQTQQAFTTISEAVELLSDKIKLYTHMTKEVGGRSQDVKISVSEFAGFMEQMSATLQQLSATLNEQHSHYTSISDDINQTNSQVQHLMGLYKKEGRNP